MAEKTGDFTQVKDRFIEERKKETQARNNIFNAYIHEFKQESRKDKENLDKVETCHFIY